jgi:uncharacterized protein (TIGR02594 family)
MALTTRPATPVTDWPPTGHVKAHRVKHGDNWGSLATLYGRGDALDIIQYNFATKNPREINWYLREYVGCTQTNGSSNYSFSSTDSPGLVYIPPASWKPGDKPAPPPVVPVGSGPPWLRYAQAERDRWAREIASWGRDKDPTEAERFLNWDEMYFQASPFYGNARWPDGRTPRTKNLDWCAAFVNWCLHRAGFSHTGSSRAGSFLDGSLWRFQALKEPQLGCVVVPGNSSAEHVTFLWDWRDLPTDPGGSVPFTASRRVRTLGGNQSNRVREKDEDRKLRAALGQNAVVSPYLWPLPGEPGCGIRSVPTERDHFCGIHPL